MLNRRQVLASLGAAAVVYGFDPVRRSWVVEAEARRHQRLPELDGTIIVDPAALLPYADDVGNIVRRIPIAVLLPGSVSDISKMIRYARRRGIEVAPRGQGHTTFGQAQVKGGLVIDMRSLAAIHAIEAERAVLDAGATWRQLVTAGLPLGLTPPVLTGYINLSIGGTLSVGGISSTNREGAQVDRVRALQVVTGTGEVEWCSERRNRRLFESVLAGLGQCGIITQAVVDMVPAPTDVRVFTLNHTNNGAFFRDLRRLLDRKEFNDVFMLGLPDGSGGWIQQINAGVFFDPASPPDDAYLLRDLEIDSSAVEVIDRTYLDYVLRVDVVIEFFQSIGMWDDVIHPWFDVWLPSSTAEDFVGETLAALTPEDVGATGFLLLFPQFRRRLTRPLLRVPDSPDWVFLFDILTSAPAPGPDPAFLERMLARNRTLFEQARQLGGTLYPIGSTPLRRRDWRLQYEQVFPFFAAAKRKFDPDRILTPGPGIF